MNLVNILAAVIGAAVLERYPNVRIAFGESGIGWIPYALDRMDFEWEDRFRDLGLTMKPSDYWRRQCKGTFQFDRIGTKLIEDMGVETLMWGSDYPHGDGVWPESSKYIEEQFGHLPADVTRKITCENAGPLLRPDQVADPDRGGGRHRPPPVHGPPDRPPAPVAEAGDERPRGELDERTSDAAVLAGPGHHGRCRDRRGDPRRGPDTEAGRRSSPR